MKYHRLCQSLRMTKEHKLNVKKDPAQKTIHILFEKFKQTDSVASDLTGNERFSQSIMTS